MTEEQLQEVENNEMEDLEEQSPLLFFLDYLKTTAGHEVATKAMALYESKMSNANSAAERSAEQQKARDAFVATTRRQSLWVQGAGLACVLAAVVVLALMGKIEGQATIALLGSLAGYFAGKSNSPN